MWRKGGILCSGVLRYRKTWTLLKPKFYGDNLKDWTFSLLFSHPLPVKDFGFWRLRNIIDMRYKKEKEK